MKHMLTFEKEKDTTNTTRYKEIPEEGKPPIVGAIYLQKWACKGVEKIQVTIEAVTE